MNQLRRRVQRLESACAVPDLLSSFVRLVQEAALAVPLVPAYCETLIAETTQRFQALSATLPRWLTSPHEVDAVVKHLCQVLRTIIDTSVHAAQREPMYTALSQACRHEAMARGAGARV
jgi:hypothetical protein